MVGGNIFITLVLGSCLLIAVIHKAELKGNKQQEKEFDEYDARCPYEFRKNVKCTSDKCTAETKSIDANNRCLYDGLKEEPIIQEMVKNHKGDIDTYNDGTFNAVKNDLFGRCGLKPWGYDRPTVVCD